MTRKFNQFHYIIIRTVSVDFFFIISQRTDKVDKFRFGVSFEKCEFFHDCDVSC